MSTAVATPSGKVSSKSTFLAQMAEAPEIINVPDDDDDGSHCPGPRNPVSAEEYAEGLNNIFLLFKEAVLEDRKDTLLSVINSLNRKITAQFEQM